MKFAEKLERLGVYVVGIPAVMIAFFLSAVSMLETVTVEQVKEGSGMQTVLYNIREKAESVIYYHDNLFVNLIVLALSLLLLFLLASRVKRIPLRAIEAGLFLWTFLLGTVWVLSSQSAPTNDSYYVSEAARSFAHGNYGVLFNERYFSNYSFQLGYVLFNEICIRFFSLFTEVKTLIVLEVVNAFFLAVIHVFTVKILDCIFADVRIDLTAAVMLALSAAPVISCAFIYGIFPGMAFALMALCCEIRWLKENRIRFAVPAVFCIAAAVMLKSNYLIWLIAMVLIALVKLPARKHPVRDSAFLLAAVALSLCIQPAVKHYYESRSGADLGESVPYVSWIAMGLNESDLAPGWYRIDLTLTNFENSGFNADIAAERSKEEIGNRLRYFLKHPQYTTDFFTVKVVSQWNETSYESIWNNVVRNQYKPKGKLAGWVCGKGKTAVRKGMDFFAQLVFSGFLAGCVYLLKRKQFLMTPLPVVFLGGFCYQLISEGKSQYILPYFVIMTGFAAFGIVSLMDTLTDRGVLKKRKETSKHAKS